MAVLQEPQQGYAAWREIAYEQFVIAGEGALPGTLPVQTCSQVRHGGARSAPLPNRAVDAHFVAAVVSKVCTN